MNGMNKVFLMGFLGSDPKKYTSKAGQSYTRLNLATHRQWRNDEGSSEQRTDWHTVFVWGRRGERCAEYLRKGASVLVEGYLSTFETNEDEGAKKWKTGVTAREVEFLPTRNKANAETMTAPSADEIPF